MSIHRRDRASLRGPAKDRSLRPWRSAIAVTAAAAVVAVGALTSAYGASTGSTTTSTGQTFQIEITTPSDGATLPIGTTSVPVGGTVALGPLPVSGTAHVAFLIDQSSSLGSANFNTEKQGAVDLFNKIRTTPGLDVNSSLFFFASNVVTVLGDQPAADNFVTAVNNHSYAGGNTHTKDAIDTVLAALSGKTGTKQVVLITDGSPNPQSQTPTAAQRTELDNAGIAVYTYAVGQNATCTPLATISTQCTEVADFASLSGTLTGTPPAGIQGVDISVNGGTFTPVDSLTSTGQITATASGLHPGSNTIELRGTATDDTTVSADVTVNVPAPVSAPTGSKTANPTHSALVHWAISDTVNNGGPATHDLNLGTVSSPPTVNYVVTATKTVSETFGLSGSVTVTNTNADPLPVTLQDTGLSPAVEGSTCTLESTTGTVPAATESGPGTLSVDYTCSFTTAPVVGTSYENVASVSYTDPNADTDPVTVTSPDFAFPAASLQEGSDQQSVTVSDPGAPGSAGFPHVITSTTSFPAFHLTYSTTGCQAPTNTASFTSGATGSDMAKVEYCMAAAAGPSASPAATPPACTASVAGGKGIGNLSITALANVQGGLLQAKLHKVHTPGTAKIKVSVTPYTGPIAKHLSKGTWHGTLIYLPPTGAPVTYCGIVFYNLKIK